MIGSGGFEKVERGVADAVDREVRGQRPKRTRPPSSLLQRLTGGCVGRGFAVVDTAGRNLPSLDGNCVKVKPPSIDLKTPSPPTP